MSIRLLLGAWVLGLGAAGCIGASGHEAATGAVDDPELAGVLQLADTLSFAALKDEVGLHQVTARAIVQYRNGADGAAGGGDDRHIDSRESLTAAGVGPQAYAKLLDYWQRFVDGQGSWRAGLPTGSVELTAVLKILAIDDPRAPTLGAPPTAQAQDVVEGVSCTLTGQNPGKLRLRCVRDASALFVEAEIQPDGSFSVATHQPFDPKRHDLGLSVSGHLGLEATLVVDEYWYILIERCFTYGACTPETDWRVWSYIRGVEQAQATLGQTASCPAEDPALVTTTKVRSLNGCPVCYHEVGGCGTGGWYDLSACLHDRFPEWEIAWGNEGCGLWESVGAYDCQSGDETVCVPPTTSDSPGVPDDEAIITAPRSAGCPDGFRRVAECPCNSYGCQPTLVCLDERITGEEIVGHGDSCSLGRHVGRSFFCPFTDFTVCLPDG